MKDSLEGIFIRNAISSDAEGIAHLANEEMGYACPVSLAQQALERMEDEREQAFVALAGDAIIGFVHVEEYRLLYHAPMANILGLAVSQAMCHRGIGRRLMQAAEEWAKEHGISIMRLNSGSERKQAHAFYQALGYALGKTQIKFLKNLE